jgi:hypothetical protein
MAASSSLHQRLLRFVQTFMIQTAQTALANGSHLLEERLARWLLMCHDRVDGDALFTTHEFLSLMLGVRRAGVTEALKVLEDRGLISTKRSQVTVLDRVKLEAVAGDSYGVPEAEYARLFGLPLRRCLVENQAHLMEADPFLGSAVVGGLNQHVDRAHERA